jgi:hypothetical protein
MDSLLGGFFISFMTRSFRASVDASAHTFAKDVLFAAKHVDMKKGIQVDFGWKIESAGYLSRWRYRSITKVRPYIAEDCCEGLGDWIAPSNPDAKLLSVWRKIKKIKATTTDGIDRRWRETLLERNPREGDDGDRPVDHRAKSERLLRTVPDVLGTDAYTFY